MSSRTFYAPGRVNLIGEYTDFNGGMVFPCAIEHGITATVKEDKSLEGVALRSDHFDYSAVVNVTDHTQPIGSEWVNYPLGILHEFAKLGYTAVGFSFTFSGELPSGAGLSSSACISVLTAFALNEVLDTGLSRQDLALLAQRSENTFVNVQCGIMDQFAIAMAERDHAIALHCDTLEHDLVPLNLGEYSIVISNTNQPRELKGSAYNDRVTECNAALRALHSVTGAMQLAHVTPEQLQVHGGLIKDPIVLDRATHVIEETDRVKRAAVALKQSDLETFGQLMVQSHQSLRDLFEVSSHALDCMVELALEMDGVMGSRMTGAGFGGCTVSLVHADHLQNFTEQVGNAYRERTGLEASFYITGAAAGVHEITSA